jgi:hypothetical protein
MERGIRGRGLLNSIRPLSLFFLRRNSVAQLKRN